MGEKRKKAAGKDGASGVSVRISPELRRRAKVYGSKNDRTLLAVVDEALEAYLKAKGA